MQETLQQTRNVTLSYQVSKYSKVHRNHKAYWGQGERGEGGMEVGEEGEYI